MLEKRNTELESNRMDEPTAHKFEIMLVKLLAFSIFSWFVWTGIIVLSDYIDGGPNDSFYDPFTTGLSPWLEKERGFYLTDFIFLGVYLAVLISIFLYSMFRKKQKKDTSRIDSYANSLGHGNAIKGLLEASVRKKAARLLKGNKDVAPGIRLGKLVYDNKTVVYSDWEAEMLIIAGPRTGKTTGYVIPSILHAPGPCIATANKRDIVDSTRSILEDRGKNIWLFDPERIASGEPTWYWDPLKSIRNLEDAKRISDCWRAAAGLNNSEGNSEFFNGGAANQLANYLLAASIEKLTIQEVFKWCQDDRDASAGRILEKHGYGVIANSVYGVLGITPETRSGIFAGMKKMIDFVVDDNLIPWIQQMGPNDNRPCYDPFEFALSKDMLYLLSQKGTRSTPITSALTAVTARAGYEISQEMGGRLPLPLLGVLDECANVCPWPELPEIYSYYGSCGIILLAFFQNMSQGNIAFGEDGFASLFNNANTFLYLGGNKDDKLLPQLSRVIGQRDILSYSANDQHGFSQGETRSLKQESIFTEQQLAEWPEFRALVLSSQNRATVVKTIPFFLDPVMSKLVEGANKKAKELVSASFSLEKIKQNAWDKKEDVNPALQMQTVVQSSPQTPSPSSPSTPPSSPSVKPATQPVTPANTIVTSPQPNTTITPDQVSVHNKPADSIVQKVETPPQPTQAPPRPFQASSGVTEAPAQPQVQQSFQTAPPPRLTTEPTNSFSTQGNATVTQSSADTTPTNIDNTSSGFATTPTNSPDSPTQPSEQKPAFDKSAFLAKLRKENGIEEG